MLICPYTVYQSWMGIALVQSLMAKVGSISMKMKGSGKTQPISFMFASFAHKCHRVVVMHRAVEGSWVSGRLQHFWSSDVEE